MGVITYMRVNYKFNMYLSKNFIVLFLINTGYVSKLSTFFMSHLILSGGGRVFKVIELGWLEYYGGQGCRKLLTLLGACLQITQIRGLVLIYCRILLGRVVSLILY